MNIHIVRNSGIKIIEATPIIIAFLGNTHMNDKNSENTMIPMRISGERIHSSDQ